MRIFRKMSCMDACSESSVPLFSCGAISEMLMAFPVP